MIDYTRTELAPLPTIEKKKEKTLAGLKFERFLRQSNYAWLLLMPDYRERWFNKSTCKLDRVNKTVFVPIDLYNKINKEVK